MATQTVAQQKIQVLVQSNPKRKGSASAKRFALYRNGMTVEQFLAAGGTTLDLMWDLTRQFITLH